MRRSPSPVTARITAAVRSISARSSAASLLGGVGVASTGGCRARGRRRESGAASPRLASTAAPRTKNVPRQPWASSAAATSQRPRRRAVVEAERDRGGPPARPVITIGGPPQQTPPERAERGPSRPSAPPGRRRSAGTARPRLRARPWSGPRRRSPRGRQPARGRSRGRDLHCAVAERPPKQPLHGLSGVNRQ